VVHDVEAPDERDDNLDSPLARERDREFAETQE